MAMQVDLPVCVRAEVDVRVRVGGGEWISAGTGEVEGDSHGAVSYAIAAALRELATEVERSGREAMEAP